MKKLQYTKGENKQKTKQASPSGGSSALAIDAATAVPSLVPAPAAWRCLFYLFFLRDPKISNKKHCYVIEIKYRKVRTSHFSTVHKTQFNSPFIIHIQNSVNTISFTQYIIFTRK